MLNKIEIADLDNGLEISNILIRDAYEMNVFDQIEKITWLEFTVTNSGVSNLAYLEATLIYTGKENEHLGHEETRGASSLIIKNKILMRIPFDFPQNAEKATLHVWAQKNSWPFKVARVVDKLWIFLKY